MGRLLDRTHASSHGNPKEILGRNSGLRQFLDLFCNKWVTLVVNALADGTHRYSGLQKRIPGISSRMLTYTLRGLQRAGLVERGAHADPFRVEYSLTPLGHTFAAPVDILACWAEAHDEDLAAVEAHQERHPLARPNRSPKRKSTQPTKLTK